MLDVIGAGFGRTGTVSMKAALEHLGFGPCYHMIEVPNNPGHADTWLAGAAGEPMDWERMLAGYRATMDWPGVSVRREVPDRRLLEYEVGQGWEPLCDFLGVDVPDEPFPRVNDSQNFEQEIRGRMAEAGQ